MVKYLFYHQWYKLFLNLNFLFALYLWAKLNFLRKDFEKKAGIRAGTIETQGTVYT